MKLGWRRRPAASAEDELRWWLEEWDPVIRAGGFHPGDVGELIGEAPAAGYEERRWQIARATVIRVEREAGLDAGAWQGQVVLDVGPGPLGFPDACPARVCLGAEPLAGEFAAHGLLLGGPGVYLAVPTEQLPLVSGSVDIVVARNSLDHVADPEAALAEIHRVLRSGGRLVVNVDVDSPPTSTEPHSFSADDIRSLLAHFELGQLREAEPHGDRGRALIGVARRR